MATARVRDVFDARYYDRFYRDPKTRAATVHDARREARFLAAYLRHIGLPVNRAADLGCGLGNLLRALRREYPRARVVGVERSEYLCERYGWTRGSVVDWTAPTPFDLVVCHDVIQYLDDRDASRALSNLAGLTRGALYLGVLTREDWRFNADRERTDAAVHMRTTRWYRRRLSRWFTAIGGGVWLRKPEAVTMWSLDRL